MVSHRMGRLHIVDLRARSLSVWSTAICTETINIVYTRKYGVWYVECGFATTRDREIVSFPVDVQISFSIQDG